MLAGGLRHVSGDAVDVRLEVVLGMEGFDVCFEDLDQIFFAEAEVFGSQAEGILGADHGDDVGDVVYNVSTDVFFFQCVVVEFDDAGAERLSCVFVVYDVTLRGGVSEEEVSVLVLVLGCLWVGVLIIGESVIGEKEWCIGE